MYINSITQLSSLSCSVDIIDRGVVTTDSDYNNNCVVSLFSNTQLHDYAIVFLKSNYSKKVRKIGFCELSKKTSVAGSVLGF